MAEKCLQPVPDIGRIERAAPFIRACKTHPLMTLPAFAFLPFPNITDVVVQEAEIADLSSQKLHNIFNVGHTLTTQQINEGIVRILYFLRFLTVSKIILTVFSFYKNMWKDQRSVVLVHVHVV
jgi:hypothetical protein